MAEPTNTDKRPTPVGSAGKCIGGHPPNQAQKAGARRLPPKIGGLIDRSRPIQGSKCCPAVRAKLDIERTDTWPKSGQSLRFPRRAGGPGHIPINARENTKVVCPEATAIVLVQLIAVKLRCPGCP